MTERGRGGGGEPVELARKVLARELMAGFATRTGLLEDRPPKRYLWTDAFAVCSFLELRRRTGDAEHLVLARRLVDQVHRTLGRHRADDRRTGWLSGLGEEEGARHPTRGGLRIGKPLPERAPGAAADSRLEWEQDGQYFHYLTQWMHALHQFAGATGELVYLEWAIELAKTAHAAFTYDVAPGSPKRMVWKMSIDLRRPLVPSMGHHDPLDALVTYLELEEAASRARTRDTGARLPDLSAEIAEASAMCTGRRWATDDPLGIGGLGIAAARLAQLSSRGAGRGALRLAALLEDTADGLHAFARSPTLRLPADHRLGFRELGLAIGLHGVERIRDVLAAREGAEDQPAREALAEPARFLPLAERIESFWSDPANRRASTWIEHRDINEVMLATSLSPDGYLRV
jgi:hypothetical protein